MGFYDGTAYQHCINASKQLQSILKGVSEQCKQKYLPAESGCNNIQPMFLSIRQTDPNFMQVCNQDTDNFDSMHTS